VAAQLALFVGYDAFEKAGPPPFGRARSCRYGRPVRRQDRDADAQYAGSCRRRSNDWIRPWALARACSTI